MFRFNPDPRKTTVFPFPLATRTAADEAQRAENNRIIAEAQAAARAARDVRKALEHRKEAIELLTRAPVAWDAYQLIAAADKLVAYLHDPDPLKTGSKP